MHQKYEYHKLQEYQRFWMHHKNMYQSYKNTKGFGCTTSNRISKSYIGHQKYQKFYAGISNASLNSPMVYSYMTYNSWGALKGQCHRIFGVGFFYQIASHGPIV